MRPASAASSHLQSGGSVLNRPAVPAWLWAPRPRATTDHHSGRTDRCHRTTRRCATCLRVGIRTGVSEDRRSNDAGRSGPAAPAGGTEASHLPRVVSPESSGAAGTGETASNSCLEGCLPPNPPNPPNHGTPRASGLGGLGGLGTCALWLRSHARTAWRSKTMPVMELAPKLRAVPCHPPRPPRRADAPSRAPQGCRRSGAL